MPILYLLIFLFSMLITNTETNAIAKTSKTQNISNVTLQCYIESSKITYSSTEVSISLNVKLEILNSGTTPIIFLQTISPTLIGTILARSPEDLTPSRSLVFEHHSSSVNTSSDWVLLHNSLDKLSPPTDKVCILMPKESWSTKGSVSLTCPTESYKKSFFPKRESWETIKEASPVWIQVIYEVWPSNIEVADSKRTKLPLGKKLKHQWQAFGSLLLYPLYSEPIQLDLSNLHSDKQ